MFAETTRLKCLEIIRNELSVANSNNPKFHSLHEGWAVLREELQEASEDIRQAERLIENDMWEQGVKNDDAATIESDCQAVYQYALHTMMEAAQLGAMAYKLITYCKGD